MKRISSLFIILLFAVSVFAQNEKSVRLSFLLSPQLSWVKSDHEDVESGGNSFGYNFGVCLNRFFTENYSFRTGLTINSTGGVLKYPSTDPSNPSGFDKVNMHLKYVEVPFGLHLKTNEFRRAAYYGQFGLSTQINFKATDQDGNSIDSEVRLMDLAYHFGGGVEYSIGGSSYLTLGIQFNNGITDITKKSGFDDKTVLNRLVFQFGLIF